MNWLWPTIEKRSLWDRFIAQIHWRGYWIWILAMVYLQWSGGNRVPSSDCISFFPEKEQSFFTVRNVWLFLLLRKWKTRTKRKVDVIRTDDTNNPNCCTTPCIYLLSKTSLALRLLRLVDNWIVLVGLRARINLKPLLRKWTIEMGRIDNPVNTNIAIAHTQMNKKVYWNKTIDQTWKLTNILK